MKADYLTNELVNAGDSGDAEFLQRFFKTGPGEYGEGDKFLGIRMPVQRRIAKENYKNINLKEINKMLSHEYHEVRMTGLLLMLYKFKKAKEEERVDIYDLYISQAGKAINNWDLVDVTAPHIVGGFLIDKDRKVLYDLAEGDLWQKRMSIISTFWFIKYGEFTDSINLAEKLVFEEHDLMHKAVGWVMREVGKHDEVLLYSFLDKYAATMPRTALRYALEKTPKDKKDYYMKLKGATN